MIKTVFYFTETEQQYLSLWRNGEVSPNTIVLCKDTHSLWKGGERYGVGTTPSGDDYVPYDDTELVERINNIVEELQELASQIGQGEKGMTEEERLQMENLAEQLSTVSDGLNAANEVAASEKLRLNGLLDGIQASINDMMEQAEVDSASIQQLVADVQSQANSIQQHSEWIQNREEEDTTSWKSGWNANIEAYLQEVGIWARDNGITLTQFSQLSQSVDQISSSVSSLLEDIQTKATKTEFSNITQRADAIETRVASVEADMNTKASTTQVSELSQTVNGIDTRVSSVETDVNGKVGSVEFSTLSQRVNSIDLAVQALTPSEDGSISDQMQATIEQAVRDGVAELNLSATYAKKSTEDDLEDTQEELLKAERILEWMYSGLKISTDPEKTFNELVSAGKSGLATAIADLRTYVQKLKNGDYVASSAITAAVNNAIAALYSEAGENNAKSLIFSKISTNTNAIDGLESDVSSVQSSIERIQGDLSNGLNNINQNTEDIAAIVTAATGDGTSATIATKFANWKAGLATKTDVTSATAGLITSDVLDLRVASFISQSDLDAATATMASKTEVEGIDARLSSVETKSTTNEASITSLTRAGGRIAQVEQKADETGAAISGLIDSSTDTVTASKIWEELASDNSVISSMRSQFATTVDGDGIASLVKEDIAQSVNNSTWDQWVAYMKGDVAAAVNNYQTATANKAQWDAVVAYVDGKKTDIESIDDLSDSVSGLSTSLAGLSSSVGTIENEVTGIKSNYAKTSMFAQIKDNQGNVTAASIAAAVNGTTGSSKVTIDADHIDVSGVLTVANNAASAASAAQNTADSALAATTTIDGGNITTGTINSDRLNVSTIVGKINSSTGQNKLTINADHIDVSGVLTVANNATTAASNAASAASAAQIAADNAQNTANSAVSAANIAQSTADGLIKAVLRIYYASSTNSAPAVPTTFITDETGGYNKWTTVRPAYSQSYKYLYTATQSKTNGNTVSTTTPVLDETTTVIDGGNIITGTVTANQLAAGCVTAAKIAAGAITANEIASHAITADQIDATNLQVAAANITGTLSASQINAANLEIQAANVKGTLNADLINTTGLEVSKLKAINSTTPTNITTIDGNGISVKQGNLIGFLANADGSGSASKGNIRWTSAGQLSVTGDISCTSITLNGCTIDGNDLDDETVGTAKIAALAVTAAKIKAGAVTTDKIDAGAVTAGKINTKAVTADKIDSGAVTADKIAAGAITADKISAGAITADKLSIGGITNDGHLNLEEITKSAIIGKLNNSTTNTTTIDGGIITTGSITANLIDATNLHVSAANIDGTITASTLSALKSFTAGGISLTGHTEMTGDGFANYITRNGLPDNNRSYVNRINYDGSGFLAFNNISWDIDGNITKLKTIQSNYVAAFENGKLSFTNTDQGHEDDLIEISGNSIKLYNTNDTAIITPGSISTTGIISASGGIAVSSVASISDEGVISGDAGIFSDTISCVGFSSSDGGEITGDLSIKGGGNIELYDSNNVSTIRLSAEDGEIYTGAGVFVYDNTSSNIVTHSNGIDIQGLSLVDKEKGSTAENNIILDNSGSNIIFRAYRKESNNTYTSRWPEISTLNSPDTNLIGSVYAISYAQFTSTQAIRDNYKILITRVS